MCKYKPDCRSSKNC